MDGYTVLHVETYEPNPTHEPGYEHVYVAIENGKMSNYTDGMIYAAKCPKQSVACIKNPDIVCLMLVSMNVKRMGYMPIMYPNEAIDTYVNNIKRPTIFIANHMDVCPLTVWVIQKD